MIDRQSHAHPSRHASASTVRKIVRHAVLSAHVHTLLPAADDDPPLHTVAQPQLHTRAGESVVDYARRVWGVRAVNEDSGFGEAGGTGDGGDSAIDVLAVFIALHTANEIERNGSTMVLIERKSACEVTKATTHGAFKQRQPT